VARSVELGPRDYPEPARVVEGTVVPLSANVRRPGSVGPGDLDVSSRSLVGRLEVVVERPVANLGARPETDHVSGPEVDA
jgi:hypothetical protein